MLTKETNVANLQAAERQRARTIHAKIARRDEKLNEQLDPLFDPSGRLFFASDDPRPTETAVAMQLEKQDLLLGVRTIYAVRTDRGLAPVEWGDKPFSPEKITGESLTPGSVKGQ
jgi:hypothetical protein